MTLSSNNTTSIANEIYSFATQLPRVYELDETWYVGLAEIAYTKSWYNVTDNKVMLVDENDKYYPSTEIVKKGYYSDEGELEKAVNKVLTGIEGDIDSYPYIKFDVVSRRVKAHPGRLSDGTKLYAYLDYNLRELLGFSFFGPNETTTMNENGEWMENTINAGLVSIRSYDLTAGIHGVYVYCNLIEPVFVGDCYTDVIRCISIDQNEKFGKDCEKIFNPIQYHKLNRTRFQSIRIGLIDDAGAYIPFLFGRSRVVLHFKKNAEWLGGEILP